MERNWLTDWEGAWIAFRSLYQKIAIFGTHDDGNGFGYRPDWQVWIEVVLWQIAIILFFGFGIRYAIGGNPWVVYGAVTFLWAIVFFFARGIDFFVVQVEKFHAAVFASMFCKNDVPNDAREQTKLPPTHAMREISVYGIRPKRPWESATFVDMRKSRLVPCKLEGNTRYGVKVTVSILLPVRPLAGALCNLVRHQEETVDKMLISMCEAKVQQYLATHTLEHIQSNLGDPEEGLKELVRTVFGGKETIDPIERDCGVFTDNVILHEFRRSDSFAASAEAAAIAENTKRAVQALTSISGVTGDKAVEAVMTMQGDATMHIVRGLEHATVVGAGVLPLGGGGGKRKDKKGKDKGEKPEDKGKKGES